MAKKKPKQERVACGSLAGTVNPETGETCDACYISGSGLSWMQRERVALNLATCHPALTWHRRVGYCHVCGAQLSFDAKNRPVARRMVPADETDEEVAEVRGSDRVQLMLEVKEGSDGD